jgi:hypothetical protein
LTRRLGPLVNGSGRERAFTCHTGCAAAYRSALSIIATLSCMRSWKPPLFLLLSGPLAVRSRFDRGGAQHGFSPPLCWRASLRSRGFEGWPR